MANPATYPLKTICSLLDLSERRVQQLSREGVIPKAERGRYQLEEAVRGYIHYLRDRSLDGGVVSLEDARKRKLNAEAELAEIELARARADVVAVDDVAAQWDAILGAARMRLLGLPTKLAPIAAIESDQSIVKELIEDGIYTALGELAAGLRDNARGDGEPQTDISPEPPEDGSAPEADDQRVGG